MIIGTKCSFNVEQLLCSINKGLTSLEFHTNYNDFFGSIDFKEVKDILTKYNVKCHAVHAPIADANGIKESISIGTFHKKQRASNIELFKKCIEVANYLCDTGNPIVVTHIGTGFNLNDVNLNNLSKSYIDKTLEEAREDLLILNEYIQNNYPTTILVVENMPSMAYSSEEEILCWYFGREHDLPEFIESLNLPNIKTCLDICHLTTTMRINKIQNPYSKFSLDDYIKSYSKTLGLVHLNNCTNLGEILKHHSQPFSPDNESDLELLKSFFTSMKKYNVNCPISLEINEVNYLTQLNVELTIKSIETIFKQLGYNPLKKRSDN